MRKAIVASSLGNIIEWYDFGLYTAFAETFAKLFFPLDNPHTGLLKIFGIFAVGFICRPIGAIIFGHYGDKIGRAKALRATILLIGIPTLLTALIPTYQQIGLLAPILLLLLRLLQGISLGGEYSGNIIYLVELAPRQHRAFIVSFAPVAANIGILLGSLVVLLLHIYNFSQNGWRFAFLIGGLLSFLVLYLRKSFSETAIFKHLKKQHEILKSPVSTTLRTMPWLMLRAAGLVAFGSVFYYLCFVYLENYLTVYVHLHQQTSVTIISICIASMLLLVPIGGLICDKIGRKNAYLIVNGGMCLFSLVGFKFLLSQHFVYIIFAMSVFTLLSALEQPTTSVTVVEQFPANLRFSGVSICYNMILALLGGTSPVIAACLIMFTHNAIAPAYYLILIAFVTLCTAIYSL